MRTNRLFEQALKHHKITPFDVQSAELTPELRALVEAGIVYERGCLLWRRVTTVASAAEALSPAAALELESLHNHIHMEDFIADPEDLRARVLFGLKLAEIVAAILPRERTRDVFLILSVDDPAFCPPILPDEEEGIPSSTFRFYQDWLDHREEENVENFRHNGVAVWRIRPC